MEQGLGWLGFRVKGYNKTKQLKPKAKTHGLNPTQNDQLSATCSTEAGAKLLAAAARHSAKRRLSSASATALWRSSSCSTLRWRWFIRERREGKVPVAEEGRAAGEVSGDDKDKKHDEGRDVGGSWGVRGGDVDSDALLFCRCLCALTNQRTHLLPVRQARKRNGFASAPHCCARQQRISIVVGYGKERIDER